MRAAERTQARLRWEPTLKCDSVLEAADDLSGAFALNSTAGSADWIHVAAAKRLHAVSAITQFWTCDDAQARAGKAAGLKIRLFRPRS